MLAGETTCLEEEKEAYLCRTCLPFRERSRQALACWDDCCDGDLCAEKPRFGKTMVT
jgi:hypothetical protein